MARRITAPDGSTWTVARRWLPERELWGAKRLGRRPRRRDGEPTDATVESPGGGGGSGNWLTDLGDDIASAIVILLAVGVFLLALLLLTSVVVPILVLGLELLLVVVLAFAGLAGRLLFRRPWVVRARSSAGRELRWHVRGFRASGRTRDEAADALARGEHPAPAGAAPV